MSTIVINPKVYEPIKQSVSLHFLRFHLVNNFHLPKPIIDDCLKDHYLLYWEPRHFFDMLHEGKIFIEDNRDSKKPFIPYQVHYKNCGPASIRKEAQIKLSFRQPYPKYSVGNHVIVMKGSD